MLAKRLQALALSNPITYDWSNWKLNQLKGPKRREVGLETNVVVNIFLGGALNGPETFIEEHIVHTRARTHTLRECVDLGFWSLSSVSTSPEAEILHLAG